MRPTRTCRPGGGRRTGRGVGPLFRMNAVGANAVTYRTLFEEIDVARGTLRRYDVQARYALILAMASFVPFVGAAGLIRRNFNGNLQRIVYATGSGWLPVFMACLTLSIAISGVGFVLGWNSAGQRRNERAAWSWAGFFFGGTVLTLSFVLLIAFMMLRLVHSSAK